ncbi:MAG: hypothetical protein WD426_02915 [Anditalea sp.]
MEKSTKRDHDRVRQNSTNEANREIDRDSLQRIRKHQNSSTGEITQRLKELQKEWDIEKTLIVNASSLTLTGLLLGTFVNKRWYIFPGVVASFLLQHGLQGWCPPLPLFRKLGIRSRQEIDEERYALKVLKGDFDDLSASSKPEEIREALRDL